MSSIVSQESKIMLLELLADEKDATRVWLRAEMDRFVDPLLVTLFCRLETKLTNGLERTQSGGDGDCALVDNPNATKLPNHPSQSFDLIAQPSPSTSLTSSLNPTLSQFNPQLANLNYSHPILINPLNQSPVPPPPVSITNQITLSNQLTNVQSQCSMPIKHEIDPTEQSETMAEAHFQQSLSAPIVNEQTNHNNWDEEDDEEECDCDDCVNGIIEEIKLEDDDSDSVEWIDDAEGQEESHQPVKKPRLDPTQSNNAHLEVIKQCSRQATQPNQVNNQDTQCITLSLQCPESGCSEMFAGVDSVNQLNHHMSEKLFLDLNRCLVRDCAQSFENKSILSQHLKQSHQHITQWHCNKCPKQFSSYKVLSNHCKCYHQLGLFQCSFPSCTFTGECKQKVTNHYTQQHKETLKCLHPGCQYETPKVSNFKQHQLSHLGIKPYRCKWLQCHYSAVQRCNLINHIRNIHLAPNLGSGPNEAQLDPKDYVELMHDLL